MKKTLSFIKDHPSILTILMMSAATACSFLFFFYVPSGSANIALFYVFALVIIARYTKGYRYGIAAALFVLYSSTTFSLIHISNSTSRFPVIRLPFSLCLRLHLLRVLLLLI